MSSPLKPSDLRGAPTAFEPRTDTMQHFIHDSLHGVGGLGDMVSHEMPFPACDGRHLAAREWWCDAAEWVLRAAVKSPEIMAALNAEAERMRK